MSRGCTVLKLSACALRLYTPLNVMDNRTPEKRSEMMRRVKSKNTGPEMLVRRLVHAMGFRYRLHRRDLPGRPDIVFASRRKIIFVHGCFWHAHGCALDRPPKSRREFWGPKLSNNRKRDQENARKLTEKSWDVLTIWQCETRDTDALGRRIALFMGRETK